jgi:tripartite-type tricarboxylate transporter receptor subunit TctC
MLAPAHGVAQSPFYAGKRLTMTINFGAGSSTDIEARLFGRHVGKHIEGQPTIIMQNMPGGGGLTASLFIGEVAPKDGSMLGYLTAAGWLYTTQPQLFRVDLKDYAFAGYGSASAIYFIRSDVAPGMKTATDIAKAGYFVSGGVNARSSRDFSIRITLDMLGRRHKHVSGYGSGEKALLALQRKEIELYATTAPLYRSQIEPTLVKPGLATPLFIDPSWDGKTFGINKQVADFGVLPFQELYKKIHGRMPEGLKWESYLTCVRLNGNLLRAIAFPPGTPPAAVSALRAAIRKLNEDKAFAAEAQKSLGYVPEFEAGEDVGDQFRNALTIRPEVREFIAKYVDTGG